MPSRASRDGGRERAHVRAGAGAVGDVDRVGEAFERPRLAQQILRIGRDRRHDLGGDDEAAARAATVRAASGVSGMSGC